MLEPPIAILPPHHPSTRRGSSTEPGEVGYDREEEHKNSLPQGYLSEAVAVSAVSAPPPLTVKDEEIRNRVQSIFRPELGEHGDELESLRRLAELEVRMVSGSQTYVTTMILAPYSHVAPLSGSRRQMTFRRVDNRGRCSLDWSGEDFQLLPSGSHPHPQASIMLQDLLALELGVRRCVVRVLPHYVGAIIPCHQDLMLLLVVLCTLYSAVPFRLEPLELSLVLKTSSVLVLIEDTLVNQVNLLDWVEGLVGVLRMSGPRGVILTVDPLLLVSVVCLVIPSLTFPFHRADFCLTFRWCSRSPWLQLLGASVSQGLRMRSRSLGLSTTSRPWTLTIA